ncbi:sucrase ferredoxin [Corynebacterium terpenotabidum]|uniref:Sucrase ferredoxin n=1 Tax=Corynebacterium terpenotabidum Y-11 TaxID=1200352 RepID=S4XLN3_9CORY|nr:sucrase ferredoxin [Corynebacterium terpenotabidum]AGP31488.1 hypothetical protein A606_09235 [Corynebacterium terpenotabidum Y-11]
MSTTRNPRSGQVKEASALPTLCSDATQEPLPGTAKTGGLFVVLEHSRNWGKDILDGDALGKELTGQIKRWLKRYRAQLQFIRRPGRAGQEDRDRVTLYIADATAEPPTLERLELSGPEELTGVDLSTPGAVPGAVRVDHPLLLVCTHGKRDRCCAVKGRPLAAGLHEKYPDIVWEASHTKGHRFAPAMILLPWNYSFGTLDLHGAEAMLDDVLAGRLPVAGNRGHGTLDGRAQVAELAVAAVLAEEGEPAGLGELTVGKHVAEGVEPVSPEIPASPTLIDGAPDPAADYAAVAAMVPEELRRRAGELMTQRIEMKITGRYEELKALKRQGHFRPIDDYERAVKEAAIAHGVYGKYSRYGKYSAYAAGYASDGQRRPEKSHDRHRKGAPVLRVTRPADPATQRDARTWLVTLESQRCYPVVSSCGDKPKAGRSWVATEVVEITGDPTA